MLVIIIVNSNNITVVVMTLTGAKRIRLTNVNYDSTHGRNWKKKILLSHSLAIAKAAVRWFEYRTHHWLIVEFENCAKDKSTKRNKASVLEFIRFTKLSVIVLCILTDKVIVAPMTMFIRATRLHFIVNSEHMSFNLLAPVLHFSKFNTSYRATCSGYLDGGS